MIKTAAVFALITFPIASFADEGNYCDAVLVHGARNLVSTLDFKSQKSYVYSKACNDQYAKSSGDTKFGIETLIQEVPIGISFGDTNDSEKVQKWCSENKNLESGTAFSSVEKNSVYGPSVEAWLECKKSYASGLKVIPSVSANNRTVAFLIMNDTSDSQVVLRGVSISDKSISCEASTDSDTVNADIKVRLPLLPKQSINISCNRELVKVKRDGQEIEILPAGTITLNTKLKNYQVSLPEQSSITITDIQANLIKEKLTGLSNSIAIVESKSAKLEKRSLCYCLDARYNGESCAKLDGYTEFKGDGKTPDRIKISYCE
jgi:hypothetical protein